MIREANRLNVRAAEPKPERSQRAAKAAYSARTPESYRRTCRTAGAATENSPVGTGIRDVEAHREAEEGELRKRGEVSETCGMGYGVGMGYGMGDGMLKMR